LISNVDKRHDALAIRKKDSLALTRILEGSGAVSGGVKT